MTVESLPADSTPALALALMRTTLLNTKHPDETTDGERGLFTHAEAVAVCDALAPQVIRMLAEADARVKQARAAAAPPEGSVVDLLVTALVAEYGEEPGTWNALRSAQRIAATIEAKIRGQVADDVRAARKADPSTYDVWMRVLRAVEGNR